MRACVRACVRAGVRVGGREGGREGHCEKKGSGYFRSPERKEAGSLIAMNGRVFAEMVRASGRQDVLGKRGKWVSLVLTRDQTV